MEHVDRTCVTVHVSDLNIQKISISDRWDYHFWESVSSSCFHKSNQSQLLEHHAEFIAPLTKIGAIELGHVIDILKVIVN